MSYHGVIVEFEKPRNRYEVDLLLPTRAWNEDRAYTNLTKAGAANDPSQTSLDLFSDQVIPQLRLTHNSVTTFLMMGNVIKMSCHTQSYT